MGFKDLTMFNEAMQAKLAWRLLLDDNSFFYRVFKARFFLEGLFLRQKIHPWPHMHGEVYSREEMLSLRVHFGERVMGNKSKYGEIIGYHLKIRLKSPHLCCMDKKTLQWQF